MKKSNRATVQDTIGIDLGDRHSHYAVLEADGTKRETGKVMTTPAAVTKRFGGIPCARIAIETGTHSPWMSRLLSSLGHEVWVANARQLPLISRNLRKHDEGDAELLARMARVDPVMLKPIEHGKPTAQADLAVLKARDVLVQVRTKLINHVRGTVKSLGARLPRTSSDAFAAKAAAHVPAELKAALEPLLSAVAGQTAQIRKYQHQIDRLAEKTYPESQRLTQVPGVGNLVGLWFVLKLGDPRRFRKSRSVGPYLGLSPRKSQSGHSDPELRITKAGDGDLRRLLVGSAHYILGPFGPDCDLRRWGMALAARGRKNAKKRAIVAVARRLAVLLHRLWISGETYDPDRQRPRQVRAVKQSA